jgi:aminopeptidase N
MLDLKTMNEDRFTSAMREFYGSYRGGRASTDDFRRVIERHTGTSMGWFFDEWFEGAATPSYKVSWKSEPAEGGKFRVRLRVLQEDVPDDFLMYVPVTVTLDGGVARVRVKVQGPRTDLELPLMPARPKELKFNDLNGVLADVQAVGWSD